MNNLIKRAITGVLFIGVISGFIYVHYYAIGLLLLLITGLGIYEFYKLFYNTGQSPQTIYGVIAGCLLFISGIIATSEIPAEGSFFNNQAFLPFPIPELNVLVFLFALPVFILELFRKTATPFQNIGITLLGIAYIMAPFLLLFKLSFLKGESFFGFDTGLRYYHPNILMGFFILIWANDTGAFIIGKYFGKHKLFERISPKKTWEGSFGGLLTAAGAAYLISMYFDDLPLIHWLVTALIIVILGSLGDLVESMLKRSVNIKDSGTILPGHGGILDRFDAVLLASPAVYIYFSIVL